MHVCVCVCVCEREERQIREREERGMQRCKESIQNRLNSSRGCEESAGTCTSQTDVKAQLRRVYHDRWDLG